MHRLRTLGRWVVTKQFEVRYFLRGCLFLAMDALISLMSSQSLSAFLRYLRRTSTLRRSLRKMNLLRF